MNLEKQLPARFSHIYIEKDILEDPETKRICSYFPDGKIIPVSRYTDIFNRRRQSYALQHQYQNLILAKKRDTFVYPGSPVCQDFSYDYFYYCAPVMNCIYDCEYCWLKGMYPSGNLVIFINQEDYFMECRKMMALHPLYLCISFDADLLSLEPLLGYVAKWTGFVQKEENLTVEVRTKSASYQGWNHIPVNDRMIFAFTLSPDDVIHRYEHGTPSLQMRLQAVKECMKAGRKVRLCIDPMIPVPDWKEAYKEMLQETASCIDMKNVNDISIGTFRISDVYLKKMRKNYPKSAIIQYPYVNENGFYHLPFHLNETMEAFMKKELKRYVNEDQIFCWEDQND